MPFWYQSKVPNSELRLSERINGKFEFSKGVLKEKELPPSKLYFAAIFFAKLMPLFCLEGRKTLDYRFLSPTEPPRAAKRIARPPPATTHRRQK